MKMTLTAMAIAGTALAAMASAGDEETQRGATEDGKRMVMGRVVDVYSPTKGAIVAFTRSAALALLDKGVRVNGVAPGPVWTPLIPATFPAEAVADFGGQAPMGRAAQPSEIAPSYVFLASSDAEVMTGQILHPNAGYIVNG